MKRWTYGHSCGASKRHESDCLKKIAALLAAFILICSIALAPSTTMYRVAPLSPSDLGKQGTKGRLFLKGHSVALYECKESVWWNAESIVDAEDSAVWFMWFDSKSPVVADHCNQGFDIIKSCSVGDVCYIANGDEVSAYECVAVDTDALNARTDMYLSTGESFMRNAEAGHLYMYTCNEDTYHITVVVWKPLADWCNGSTADFDSAGDGSAPSSASNGLL